MLDARLFELSQFSEAEELAPETLIVTPTFCERDTIEDHIRSVGLSLTRASILIVDDASPDGTADAADALRSEFPRLHVLRRIGPRSFAGSYREGSAWALKNGFSRIVSMDADGSHPAIFLPLLLSVSTRADLVVGSRYLNGVSVLNWSLRRVLLSAFGNVYARLVTGIPCYDLTSGFCCYRADILRTIDMPYLRASGYAYQIEMKYRIWRMGAQLAETNILFIERRAGTSKISTARITEGLWHPWWCRFVLGRPASPTPAPIHRVWTIGS